MFGWFRVADKVHNPAPITTYATAEKQLIEWDTNIKELAKIEKQEISDMSKRTILRRMLPQDLMKDVKRDRTLTSWKQTWDFVMSQFPLRKHWNGNSKAKKGPNDMEVDAAEEEDAECPVSRAWR